MANPPGCPIWFELMTSDADAAQAFYTKVFDWSVAPFGNAADGTSDYRVITASDGEGVGGILKPPHGGPPTGWFMYVGVDDVDAAVEKLVSGGGAVHMPAMDIPNVGRIAMVADAQGVIFYVMKGAVEGDSHAFKPGALGHGEWLELYAADDAAAIDFYGDLFGWKKFGSMPMGEMGEYSFLVQANDDRIGAVMRAPPGQRPLWNVYFRVGAIDPVEAAITAAGGTIVQGAHQVPGGDWIVVANDPQGGLFGCVGSR